MASTTTVKPKRVVVIGAGLAGLVAAKTYLEVDPNIKMTIIDSERTIGGVWCKDRCFPGFLVDSPVGLFDFSDIAMRDVIGLKDWSDLPGDKVYEYLHIYADKFGLLERLRLETKVSRVFRNSDGKAWNIEIAGSNERLTCDKLIISTGLHSNLKWPDVSTKDFTGLTLHTKDMGLHYQNLMAEKIKRVTVYGGCKSAVDAILLCTSAGKKVDWVIRENGNGAATIYDFKQHGIHAGMLASRWKNIFTPSIFNTCGFWYRFLHSGNNKVGNWFIARFWEKAGKAPLGMRAYRKDCPNVEKIKPETGSGLFFTAGFSGIHRTAAADKFIAELHSGNLIQVHRATITSMSGSEVTLSNGEVLPSDAAVFATGYQSQSTLFSAADALALGVNAPLTEETPENAKYWGEMERKAEEEVLTTLPILRNPPPHNEREVSYTPYRLYRHIIPSALAAKQDRSLAFVGFLTSVQTTLYSEVAALWAVAWLDGLMDLPTSKEEMDYNIAKVNLWSRRRYLSRGRIRQIASAEIQDVTDMLMRDMCLEVYRSGNFLKENFAPVRSQWYKGIVQELLAQKRGPKNSTKRKRGGGWLSMVLYNCFQN